MSARAVAPGVERIVPQNAPLQQIGIVKSDPVTNEARGGMNWKTRNLTGRGACIAAA